MKYAIFTLPSKKLCLLMALAAGLFAVPLSAEAARAVQHVEQQSGVVKGQVTDKSGEGIIGATVKLKGSTTTGTDDALAALVSHLAFHHTRLLLDVLYGPCGLS